MFQPFFHPLRHALLNDGKKLGGLESAIKSIQFHGWSFPADSTYQDYTISEVDLNFAVIYDLGFSTNWDNARSLTRKVFLNSTTVRATTGGNITTFSLAARFFVVEFEHLFIKSMQHITPVFPEYSNSQNETISSVDINKTHIISAGWYIEKDVYFFNAHNVQLYFLDSTTIAMLRNNAGADDDLYMSLFVLEFK